MTTDTTVVPGKLTGDDLLAYGADHVFHMRYSTVEAVRQALILTRGSGMVLETHDGRRLLDAIATHHNVNLGHCHPELIRAAHEQMQSLDHVLTVPGFTNEPLVNVTKAILRNPLPGMATIFYTLTGAEAVEATMKMARYYWHALGRSTKSKFISLNLGYHGNSFATLAATGRDHDGLPSASGRRLFPAFDPLPEGYVHVLGPYDFHDGSRSAEEEASAACDALEKRIAREGADTVAAFLFEPLQGHNFYQPHPAYYRRVRQICDDNDILLISDEMITGFGRTGRWWGMSHYPGVEPDLTAFGKGVTSGALPLSGAITSAKVWDVIQGHAPKRSVEITGTYGGHPTLCAVAQRNIEVLEEQNLIERVDTVGDYLRQSLRRAFDGSEVFEVRGTGMIGVVEFKAGGDTDALRQQMALEAFLRDVIIRAERGTVGPLISITPPFIATEEEIDTVVARVHEAVSVALAAN